MFEKFTNRHGKGILQRKQQNFFKKYDNNHYSTYSIMKVSVIEWFNYTLKNDIWEQFTYNGNYKWIDLLPRLMSEYNVWKHRIIGMRPIDVIPAIADKPLTTVYSHV